MTIKVERIAHRGFSAIAPENTLAAFVAAIQQGANSIEFDVQLSADGIPIIFHDAILDRITGTSGKVQETSLEQLKILDAGAWFDPEFIGEKIPTLTEALVVLKRVKKFLYFDVKPHCHWSTEALENLLQLLAAEGLQDQCIITSFNDQVIEQVRQQSSEIQLGHIVANELDYRIKLEKAVAGGDTLISSEYHLLLNNPSLVEITRNQGVDVVAWTVDHPDDWRQLTDIGITRIVTNALLNH